MDSGTTATAASAAMGASDKPLPKDFSHYYSVTTANRQPSAMKQYYKYFQIPGIGNLAGGLPNVRFFPFDTLEAQSAKPERWTPSPNAPASNSPDDAALAAQLAATLKLNSGSGSGNIPENQAAAHITVPKALAPTTDPLRKVDLATALQYGTAQGYPPLLSFLKQFATRHLHPNAPYAGGPDVCLTVGSTDGFSKTLEMFVDPWSSGRDPIENRPGLLCETFVYGNVLSQAQPRGVQAVPVKADEGGMVATGPGGLEHVLANWDYSKGRRPHLLYTVTMGHNPTGILLSLERRKALYAVCSKYDVIIVEDDPYWYLQFPSAAIEEGKSRGRAPNANDPMASFSQLRAQQQQQQQQQQNSTGYPFLDSLVPSFLSVDTDGRVVRLDTFSKTVAPGCRLGWITAQPALVERYVRITETSTQQPSGFVQSVISELVIGQQQQPAAVAQSWLSLRTNTERAAFTGWQMDGWVRWIAGLRGEYERRMNRMCRILDEGAVWIKQGTPRAAADSDVCVLSKVTLYEFDWPRGGMFVWLRVFFESHPLFGVPSSDGADIIDGTALSTGLLLFMTQKPYLVLVSPGMMFSATEAIRRNVGWQYFRLCFAAETEENVDACSQRFTQGVKRFWGIKTAKELEEIIKDSPVAAAAAAAQGDEEEEQQQLGNLGMYMGC
ncbi:unnamed protein product [Discula destructiva]